MNQATTATQGNNISSQKCSNKQTTSTTKTPSTLTTNMIKSSVKRLFSPSSAQQQQQLPSTPLSTKKPSTRIPSANLGVKTSTNKSLENISTISSTSSSNSMSETGDAKRLFSARNTQKLSTSSANSAAAAALLNTSKSPKTIKKSLNIFKSNSKKATASDKTSTISSISSNGSLPPPPPAPQFAKLILPPPPPPPPGTYDQQVLNTNEQKQIRELQIEIETLRQKIQLTDSNQLKIKELNAEIERLSRLYDYEIGKQAKYEEKITFFKQIAEERQIESAALKYEFRKIQDLKDSLFAENSYLKSYINQSSSSSPINNKSPLNKHNKSTNTPSPRISQQQQGKSFF